MERAEGNNGSSTQQHARSSSNGSTLDWKQAGDEGDAGGGDAAERAEGNWGSTELEAAALGVWAGLLIY